MRKKEARFENAKTSVSWAGKHWKGSVSRSISLFSLRGLGFLLREVISNLLSPLLHLASTINSGMPAFQQTSDFPSPTFLSLHFTAVEDRSTSEPLAFYLSTAMRRGKVSVPTNNSQAGEVPTISKESKIKCLWRRPPLWSVRTTAFKARYPPVLLPLLVLPTNFFPVGGQDLTTPEDEKGLGCLSRHPTASFRSFQILFWSQSPCRTFQTPVVPHLDPRSGTEI